MKEMPYKTFSLQARKKKNEKFSPSLCQLELTFRCSFHCRHCYTDCFNRAPYIYRELSTKEVMRILDMLRHSGVLWLCFTGGDPLSRKDFFDIYHYAKTKGFLIMIFTNGYLISEETIKVFEDMPPFVIEITLNAINEKLFEKISGVEGSFSRTMQAIRLIEQAKLPLKIKTQITKDNFKEVPQIGNFVRTLGVPFSPDFDLSARLDGDLSPCALRIPVSHAIQYGDNSSNGCLQEGNNAGAGNNFLFRCAILGGEDINIDPYGRMISCTLIRKPGFDLRKMSIAEAYHRLSHLKGKKFSTDSKCNGCSLRALCRWCPGKAGVEKGSLQQPIEYYCRLARHTRNSLRKKYHNLFTKAKQ